MSDNGPPREQSMQEILASIRRVISADEPRAGDRPGSEVLDLTPSMKLNPYGDDRGSVEELTVIRRRTRPVIEAEPLPIELTGPSTTEDVEEPGPSGPVSGPDERDLVAERAQAAARDAFDRTTGSDGSAAAIDPLVREMLRPMLREWLDQNLPDLLERVLRSEVRALRRKGQLD